jgi:hypothetical protein
MAGIFISYRREDTSGEASHLAADLADEVGRRQVFIDIDTIGPGVDFAQSIDSALTSCEVVLILIGDRWLSVTNAEGKRRLDAEDDFVVTEVAKALERTDVTVVPVLVEGATMPTAAQLPPRIAGLATRNALELTSKRWRYDLDQILALVRRGPGAKLRRVPTWARVAVPLALAATIAGVVLASGGGGEGGGTTPATNAQRPILAPATVASAVDVCSEQLSHLASQTVDPFKCKGGGLNQLAWAELATRRPVTFELGPNATPQQVHDALCVDAQNQEIGTTSLTVEVYQLAQLYYGWQFAISPIPDFTGGGCG